MSENKRDTQHHIIAGIGSSADGIKNMEVFLKNMPGNTGITFVVIQHLSPEHKSILPEILQKSTKLKVTEIEDKTSPEPDHVYVLPAGYDVTISGNKFHLQKYSRDKKGLHLPIDLFLRSLAADRKDKTAAILLSGGGSDGSLGIKEIKDAGGLLLVQDPESAKFRSMPQNAIDTGLVDKVAKPEDLPGLLLEFHRSLDKEDHFMDDRDSDEQMRKLFQMLKTQTGHDFSEYKKSTIRRRITRRMVLHKKSRLSEYTGYLKENPPEVDNLFRELLIGVTSFFRNKKAFDTLKKKVFPEIINPGNEKTVRVWVAACSSGEEVYSLAILAKEYQESQQIRTDIHFFATDIDPRALEVARTGKYKENIRADVPAGLLDKYFQKKDDIYQVHKDIRDMITFAEHSAIKDPPYSKLDLISCRNFLIYLEPEIQKHVLNAFHYALKPGRFIFLGSSESQSQRSQLFETVDAKARIYQKKENRKAVINYLSQSRKQETREDGDETHVSSGKKKLSVKEFAEKKALKEYMNPFLVIDKKGEIQYSLGQCDKYLKFHVGEPNQNIINLAREGLGIPISSALRKIKSENKPVTFRNIKVKGTNGDDQVSITLTPVNEPAFLRHMVIVTIKPVRPANSDGEDQQDNIREISRESDDHIRQMEQELQETREYLNNVIEDLEASNEELKSTNEEFQSTNEELQSTNEELETSKEELQSLNEELESSNNELQRKNEEETRLSNDLHNFMQSIRIGTLFLDKNYKIRRYSPPIKDIVNLTESDTGRSIKDFGISFPEGNLIDDIRHVMDDLSPVEKDISVNHDRHYWMRILPYRTPDDRIDGVVITFTDISERYRNQKIIEESERWRKYRDLFHHIEHGFTLYQVIENDRGDVDDLRLAEANQAFADMMDVDLDSIKDRKVSELNISRECRDGFISAAKKVLGGKPHQEERYFENSGRHLKILYFSHEGDIMASFVQDITGAKEEMKAQVHLASIVESSDDAIFSESPEGKILSWNEGAEELYGYSEKEAVGSMANDLYAYPKDDGDMAMIKQVRKGGKVKNRDTFHKRKDGSVIPVSVTKSPIKNKEGEIIAISNIVKDITEIKKREEELVKAKEATEQASSLKTLFLANMSHEIRTPLNSILGFTDMLKEEITDKRLARFVENILNSSKQLLNLINDIVDVSRLDAGELPVHNSNVNICELMKKTKEQFRGYAAESKKQNIEFRLNLPEELTELHVITDEHRLRQILYNLLSNAFKYTTRGHIEFGLKVRDNKTLLFYIEDTGKGISKEYHKKIFERFQQEDDGRDQSETVIRGTGLGLAIARGLAELLEGKMWVDSEKGKGSVFYFTIPFNKGETPGKKDTQPQEEGFDIPVLEGKKIIVAEDDPYSLQMLKYMLKDTKVTMLIAKDGEKVLELFTSEQVDMILLDIRMPKKDGYELIKEIRAKNTDIPVIAQTAFAMPEQVKKSLETGFNEHLTKPIAKEDLYSVLRKYLSREQ